jgi:hypothetical protein
MILIFVKQISSGKKEEFIYPQIKYNPNDFIFKPDEIFYGAYYWSNNSKGDILYDSRNGIEIYPLENQVYYYLKKLY